MARSKWYTLLMICCCQILCCVDNSIMLNAMSALVRTFRSSVAAVQLANSIYPLVAGALMLAGGLLGLKLGWKRLLCVGLLMMVAGEAIAGLSPNMPVFTWVARVLAGLGASLVIPAAIGLIPATYSGKDLSIGFGALGAAVGVAALAGPILGGWVIDTFGFRVAFFGLAAAFALTFLFALRINEQAKPKAQVQFDYVGTVLFACGMILLTVGLVNIITWSLPATIGAMAGGAVLLVLFIVYERHLEKKRPIVLLPLRFLLCKQTRAGLIMTALVFLISGGLGFALVTYLQVVRQFDALHTGLVLMINAIGIVIFSIGVPLVIKRPNPRLICQSAIVLCFIAAVVVAFSGTPSGMNTAFFIGIFFIGASSGLLSSQAGVIVTSSISKEDGAQSGGIQGSMRNIGQAMGIALIGLIMISSLTTSVKRGILDNPVTRPLMGRDLKLSGNIPFVTDAQVRSYLADQHIDAADADALVSNYTHSRVKALRISFIVFGGIILLFLVFTFRIPHSYEKETPS